MKSDAELIKEWIASKFIIEVHNEQDYIDALTLFEEQIEKRVKDSIIREVIDKYIELGMSDKDYLWIWLIKKRKDLEAEK